MRLSLSLLAMAILLSCEPKAGKVESSQAELVSAKPGPVPALVLEALAQARSDKRRLVVYVGASWCEPCEYFLEAVKANTLPEQFRDLRFLKFDNDVDEDRLAAAGYGGQMIPRFVLPGREGLASERRFEGSVKGPEAIANIAPRLDALLETK